MLQEKKYIYIVMNNDDFIRAFTKERKAKNFLNKKEKELKKREPERFQMLPYYHIHTVELLD
jgi:hypothetical protein